MNQLSIIMSGKFLVPHHFSHVRERMVQFNWFGVHHLSVQDTATHCFLRDRRNGMVAWNEREGENQLNIDEWSLLARALRALSVWEN